MHKGPYRLIGSSKIRSSRGQELLSLGITKPRNPKSESAKIHRYVQKP
jgi:hypothetical protein